MARPGEGTITMHTDGFSRFRLFQLISPSLPTGAFTYSQALEWAVEYGWVQDRESLDGWLESLLYSNFRELEIPLLKRLYDACAENDRERFTYWNDYVVACRETSELRNEEKHRGRAMARVLAGLDDCFQSEWLESAKNCQLGGFAFAACRWRVDLYDASLGYVWGWLENMVMAAIKIVPLGQTPGQQSLAGLADAAVATVREGLLVKDEQLGGSCPAFAIGSSLHETQYTRLFRS